MGEMGREALKLRFDRRLRLEFHGARITSDAGLLACRELDEALRLTEVAVPRELFAAILGRVSRFCLAPG